MNARRLTPKYLADEKNIYKIQQLLLRVGYNWWSTIPYEICAFSIMFLKNDNLKNDKTIPRSRHDLQLWPGCGRKVAVLILQELFSDFLCGIICDTHVAVSAIWFGWTRFVSADAICDELEQWIPKHLWKDLNPVLAGIRQLAKEKDKDGVALSAYMRKLSVSMEETHKGMKLFIGGLLDATQKATTGKEGEEAPE